MDASGRSKDQRARKAGIDPPQPSSQEGPRPETGGPHKRNSQVSSSKRAGRGGEGAAAQAEHPGDPTMDKLARQGFLTQEPVSKSSKPSGSSAMKRDSIQSQQQFPPRHQSLGHGPQRSGQDWSTEHSSNSMDTRSQQPAASITARQQTLLVPQHRVQSSVTTRSTTRQSGPPQSYQSPRQFSSTTTTITTSRNPNSNLTSRQQQQLPQGKHSSRSDSPPPPPPPPKDNWHQSKSHQRSLSNVSSISAARPSSDMPSQRFNFGVAKDTDYQPNPHQRSTSKNSFTEPVPASFGTPSQGYDALKGPPPPPNYAQTTDTASPHLHPYHPSPQPSRVFNVPKGASPPLNTPPTADTSTYHLHPYPANPQPSRVFNVPKSSFTPSPPRGLNPTDPPSQADYPQSASVSSRQSLPALQTTMPSSSPPPLKFQGQSDGASDLDARNFRRSQIESPGQPRAERAPAPSAVHPTRTLTATGTSSAGGGGVGNAHEGRRGGSHERSTEDEPIIMSATSFPGQEWQPSYGWDGD